MTTQEVAAQLVQLCSQGKFHDAMEALYSPDIVSMLWLSEVWISLTACIPYQTIVSTLQLYLTPRHVVLRPRNNWCPVSNSWNFFIFTS